MSRADVRTLIALATAQAAADVERRRADPAALASLPLGRFSDAGIRSLLLRRTLLGAPLLARLVESLALVLPPALGARLGRLSSEVAYWRAARSKLSPQEWMALTHAPVILMYHAIGGAGEPGSRYILPRARFERQLAWLRARRYRMLSLRQILDSRQAAIPTPRAVALTFDDGYEDNASPLLASGAPATIFVVTGAAGGTNGWDATGPLRGRRLLGWEELRRLRGAGVEIGGHSRTHPILPELPPAELQAEFNGSLADLRRELGAGCYTFAYPHGRFDEETKRALDAACAGDDTRYTAAACSRGGVNEPWVPLDELRRVEIKGTDSFLSFILMVSLGRRITPGGLLRSLFFG